MEREKVIELYSKAQDEAKGGQLIEHFARLVGQETLERVAKHFDDRGRHIDGGWSEGWYEPQEPGDIIRNLKKSTVND